MMFRGLGRLCDARRRRGLALSTALLLAGCGGGASQGPGAEGPESGDSEGGESVGAAVGGDEGGEAGADTSHVPAPPQGAAFEETRSMSLGVDLKLLKDGRDAGMMGKSWSFEEGRKMAIEKLRGNAVTRLAVVYGTREGKGLEDWTPLPTEGKGYTVQVEKGGGLAVFDADDRPASAAEQEVAVSEYGYLGRPNPLLVQVVAAERSEGDKISLDAAGALALIGYMPEMDVGELSVVYQGTGERAGRGVAELDVTFASKLKEVQMVYAMSMTGPAYVDVKTGWVMDLDLSGKVKVSGKLKYKGQLFDVEGAGKVTFARKAKIR
jgi:hypothetical protein